MMKKNLLILLGALTISCAATYGQSEEIPNIGIQKANTGVGISKKEKSAKSVSKVKSTDLADPSKRVIATDNSSSEFPKQATRTNSDKSIKEISYSLDNNNSALTNLLMLIEMKEKVNRSGNQQLINSSEYNQLNIDISATRAKFDSYVEKTGIKNCNQTEQSYFLAFLKEEGRDEEYKEAISKLN